MVMISNIAVLLSRCMGMISNILVRSKGKVTTYLSQYMVVISIIFIRFMIIIHDQEGMNSAIEQNQCVWSLNTQLSYLLSRMIPYAVGE